MLMTNGITVIIAFGAIARLKRLCRRKGESLSSWRDKLSLSLSQLSDVLRTFETPACASIEFALSIVRIFSAVNIYVIYGEFNEASVRCAAISMTPGHFELRVCYAGVAATVKHEFMTRLVKYRTLQRAGYT